MRAQRSGWQSGGLGVLEGGCDGMNQLGLAGGRTANPTPYADTTGYSPVNSPYVLNDPSRWQPDIQRKGSGLYRSQVFVTPQYGTIEPLAGFDPEQFPFLPQRQQCRQPQRLPGAG